MKAPLPKPVLALLLLLASLSFAHDGTLLSVREESEGEEEPGGGDEPPDSIVIAHGICMALAFVILFPLGASWMRFFNFRGLVWFHAGWQLLTYVLVFAGTGTGIYLSVEEGEWDGHPIIGLVVILALAVQALLGLFHHLKFRRTGRPTTLGISHRWWGRIVLVVGAIDGGLGLKLAEEESTAIVVYCVLAGVFFSIWGLSLIVDARREGKKTAVLSGPRASSDNIPLSDRISKESAGRA
ncbi:hypothetical protein BU26DRAFT_523528 [Trematosphaeria pertusa]|uniref:Cytochrome b561 domain-containing protein n=1 Tax=Trematosphaeria pertusa TaxID=390896 RepID=A0A6A6I0Y8_9PLEO|nr:uncharacterized protein BU26DRAFT_523528 [Trematosphaeria pertusa]KAF2243981.1 hypothetical protein BU26DRAFT_523528 [Trematosphaeria pertusa]